MSDPAFPVSLTAIGVLLLLSAFFSASETAFTSLAGYHLQKLAEKDRRGERLDFWFRNPQRVLITVLFGNTVVNIAASVLAASVSYRLLHRLPVFVIALVMSFVILLYGEILPKSVAKRFPEQVSLLVALPMRAICALMGPVTKLMMGISGLQLKLFGLRMASILPVLTEDDLKAMIAAGEEGGIVEEEERKMIHSIFELGDTTVSEIMKPRVGIVAVEEATLLPDILEVTVREGYSRLPVYQGGVDRITGVVNIKDVLAAISGDPQGGCSRRARDVMRPAYFVPETKKVQELLRELREAKLQMAVVVDEYGGTAGLVTMEDLVEEIVGEIYDEYKKETSQFQALPEGTYLVQGGMEVEKANEEMGLGIPEGKVETVAGFILDFLGRFPARGEKFLFRNFEFVIQEADRRTISRVKIRKVFDGREGADESGGNRPPEA